MTPNVCLPYHLLLTVNFYNLTSMSSPTRVLCGNYSSMSLNAHCCPLVQTITAFQCNLFPYYTNNCETTSCSHHKDLGITMSSNLSWSISILLKSLRYPKLTIFLVCSTELSWLPTASQHERVCTFPWSVPNCSTVLRFRAISSEPQFFNISQ